MVVLFDLYYDLTCQDLAPEFEDRHETFFAEGTSYLMQLMVWDPLQLQGIRGHTTRVRLWRAACVRGPRVTPDNPYAFQDLCHLLHQPRPPRRQSYTLYVKSESVRS